MFDFAANYQLIFFFLLQAKRNSMLDFAKAIASGEEEQARKLVHTQRTVTPELVDG